MSLYDAITQKIDSFKQYLRERKEARYREYHLRGNSCPNCCLRIESSGYMWRPVRSTLFFCQYDIPERAGKIRYDLTRIRNNSKDL